MPPARERLGKVVFYAAQAAAFGFIVYIMAREFLR